jgi:hypothetical protein
LAGRIAVAVRGFVDCCLVFSKVPIQPAETTRGA